LLLGESIELEGNPRDQKLELGRKIATRYHDSAQADAGVQAWLDWASDRTSDAKEVAIRDLPEDLTVLKLVAAVYELGFGMIKSNAELKKQSIGPGAIQLNDEKLTDPFAKVEVKPGDFIRLSKKFTAKLI
jgi:tyrosyl-tRNA synthetase